MIDVSDSHARERQPGLQRPFQAARAGKRHRVFGAPPRLTAFPACQVRGCQEPERCAPEPATCPSFVRDAQALADAISNLQQETRRQAVTITPVQLAGNEIYEILKKRLIDEMPDERVLSDVAREYVQQIKKAEDGGYITATGIEQIAAQVRETYPFHPSFKHLACILHE